MGAVAAMASIAGDFSQAGNSCLERTSSSSSYPMQSGVSGHQTSGVVTSGSTNCYGQSYAPHNSYYSNMDSYLSSSAMQHPSLNGGGVTSLNQMNVATNMVSHMSTSNGFASAQALTPRTPPMGGSMLSSLANDCLEYTDKSSAWKFQVL